jgi:hypothetical protein
VIATLVSAIAVVLSAALGGQLICTLFGARRWTPAAPAVGLSVSMLIVAGAPHLPGRTTWPFVITMLLTLAGLVKAMRQPEHRPPAGAWLAGGLTLLITLIPFYAQGRFGILGVSFNNDMGAHLIYAGAYGDAALEAATPLLNYYPFGPHAFVAEMAHGFGFELGGVFTGLTIAMPVLSAITVFGLIRRFGRLPAVPAVLAAAVATMSYLPAAYLGQGAFKELMLPLLLFGTVGLLGSLRRDEVAGPARLVGLGLIAGGVLSMYSLPGLAWLAGTIGLVAVALALIPRPEGRPRRLGAEIGALVLPALFAGAVLLVSVIPQIPRLHQFWEYMHRSGASGTGIAKEDLGNLAGPLRFLESTGIWISADFRYPPAEQAVSVHLGLIVLAAAAWGAVRLMRRGEPEIVAAAATCVLLADWSTYSQSPYTTAKAYAILTPFLVVLAAVALLERRSDPPALRLGRLTVAVGLVAVAAASSFLALRSMPVGPRTNEQQLAKLRPLVQGKKVLLTLNDESGGWYLSGAVVVQPSFAPSQPGVGAAPPLPVKDAGPNHAYDWDSFGSAGGIDRFDAVVMVRDSSGSQAPPNFKLRATSGPWQLWVRTGPSKLRSVLPGEGAEAGVILDCASPEGKAVLKGGGVAGIRQPPTRAVSPLIVQGQSVSVPVELHRGRWLVNVAYTWGQHVHLQGQGLDVRLPPSLARLGTRFPVGEIDVPQDGTLVYKISAEAGRLARSGLVMAPVELSFTPAAAVERTVPVRQACGKYLDWHEPEAVS